jgi:hypothetical protein
MKKIAILLFVSMLFACGGDKSSPPLYIPPQHSPAISNLFLSPSFANVGDGSGAVTIYGYYDFIDIDKNISKVTINWYDTLGRSGTIPGNANLSGYASGLASVAVIGDTTVASTTYFEFYVTDSTGLKSNKLTGSWTVYP